MPELSLPTQEEPDRMLLGVNLEYIVFYTFSRKWYLCVTEEAKWGYVFVKSVVFLNIFLIEYKF